MMSLDRREDQSGKQISFHAHSNLSELHTLHILHNTILNFLYFPSKKRWVEKKTRCVLENEKINLESNFHFWLRCMHIAYCICIRTIKSKSAKECLNFNEKSMDPAKRKWCHLTAGRSIWKAISLSCTSFTILFELPALHIASLYQGNQKQICQMRPPLKLQIKGNWHWQLSKLRSTLTSPAKRAQSMMLAFYWKFDWKEGSKTFFGMKSDELLKRSGW